MKNVIQCPTVLNSVLIKQKQSVYDVTQMLGLRAEQTRKEYVFFVKSVCKEMPGF